ncbi:uncharacterized protein MYCFIDRAFT_210831 [Pseudocercospora fijiensis CIRAD86]|uniref:KOW domain-containing protein n=1 Tax=Pseudocercospora fijiensis (strain CIRAD86) TaxID=383855 RepID=M2ZZC3_PSEFD|nr:uncharacterized protein MYCFIDRAFT_210831 [Pseudocercospora fijiensis CIRAD86]EME84254.1 hypothetical protein MYCFIDRAFT_210831 [Pseudocercospora fijiensis CIRAD86]
MVRENTKALQQDRKNRREDWQAGALAPRRDVGDLQTRYGAIPVFSIHLPERDPEARPKWAPIRKGDRVVVLSGRDRGKIGEVKDYDSVRAAVQVAGLNMVDIIVPEWLRQEKNIEDQPELQSVEKFFHLEDVRLVFPLPDPETGEPRDAIIDQLVETSKGRRAIAGTNTIIPYPPQDKAVGHTDYDCDTVRMVLEERTFIPTLIRSPMPLSVIDELRGRYSKFRTRHHHEYIQRKEAEDVREQARKGLIKTMRTPLQQLAELREKKKKEEDRELTVEQLARIGEVMAMERTRKLGGQAATA